MRKLKREPDYLRIMAIAHGKSELALCRNIFSTLRLPNKIISNKNGVSSIQVAGLKNFLNSRSEFKSLTAFKRYFPNIEIYKQELIKFKLFIIMDVDDCTDEECNNFKSGDLFNDHWLHPYIVPIYNEPHLEQTMKEANIEIKKKSDYIEIFPRVQEGSREDVIVLLDKIREAKCSNLEEFLTYCLNCADNKILKI